MKLKPFKMARFFAQNEFAAPYLFCCSNCESLSVGVLLNFERNALKKLLSLRLGYTESPGSVDLHIM